MNRADVARLLGVAAAFDSRTVGETDVAAWTMALDGLDTDRCRAAIVKHYRTETDRIMPAHIRRLARTTTGVPGVIPETGEAFCDRCKGMHRPAEPCSVLAIPRGFKAAIGSAFRSVADALDPAPEPKETPVPRPLNAVEKRCAAQVASTVPLDFRALPTVCLRCGTTFLDYPDGRDSHLAVFGHKARSADDAADAPRCEHGELFGADGFAACEAGCVTDPTHPQEPR